jgi:hypothetical protein
MAARQDALSTVTKKDPTLFSNPLLPVEAGPVVRKPLSTAVINSCCRANKKYGLRCVAVRCVACLRLLSNTYVSDIFKIEVIGGFLAVRTEKPSVRRHASSVATHSSSWELN